MGAERALNQCMLVLTLTQVLARVRRRRSPIIAPEAKQWHDQDNGQFVYLRYLFMNIGEFVEQNKAVKEPPGVDKLLTLHFSRQVSSTYCSFTASLGERQ